MTTICELSIINPSKQVVKGYQNIMPAYPTGPEQGQLTEEQVLSLVAYIKTLGVATPGAPAPAPPGKNGTPLGKGGTPTTRNGAAPSTWPAKTSQGSSAVVTSR